MTKYSQKESSYRQMYLINKFEKDLMENTLSNMRDGKRKLNENVSPKTLTSKETQTNTTPNLNEVTESLNNTSDSSGNETINQNNIPNNTNEQTANNEEEENLKSKYIRDAFNKLILKHTKGSNKKLGVTTRRMRKNEKFQKQKNQNILVKNVNEPISFISRKTNKNRTNPMDSDFVFRDWKI